MVVTGQSGCGIDQSGTATPTPSVRQHVPPTSTTEYLEWGRDVIGRAAAIARDFADLVRYPRFDDERWRARLEDTALRMGVLRDEATACVPPRDLEYTHQALVGGLDQAAEGMSRTAEGARRMDAKLIEQGIEDANRGAVLFNEVRRLLGG